MEQIIQTVYNWVWSPALVAICLLAGLYFSIGTRFVQVRRFREKFPDARIDEFYSDSHSDDPLAALAGKAVLVRGERLCAWNEG